MRIVTRQELIRMPSGTLYHEWTPCILGPLNIKGDTLYTDGLAVDWYEQLVPEFSSQDSLDTLDYVGSAQVRLDIEGREALYDDSLQYAVWDRSEVEILIARLQLALQTSDADVAEDPSA